MSGRTLEAALEVRDLASVSIRQVSQEFSGLSNTIKKFDTDQGGGGGGSGGGEDDNGGILKGIGRNMRGLRDLTRAVGLIEIGAHGVGVAMDLWKLGVANANGDLEKSAELMKAVKQDLASLPFGIGTMAKLGSDSAQSFWGVFYDPKWKPAEFDPLGQGLKWLANRAFSDDVTGSQAADEQQTKSMQESAKHRASIQKELDAELRKETAAANEAGMSEFQKATAKAEAEMDAVEEKVKEMRGKIRPSEDKDGKMAAEADAIEAEGVRKYQAETLKIRQDAMHRRDSDAADAAAQVNAIEAQGRADALRAQHRDLEAELVEIKAHYQEIQREADKAMREKLAKEPENAAAIRAQADALAAARVGEEKQAEAKATAADADRKAQASATAQGELLEMRIQGLHEEGKLGNAAAEQEAKRLEIAKQFNAEREQLRKIIAGEADDATKDAARKQLAGLDADQKKQLAGADALGSGGPALVQSLGLIFGKDPVSDQKRMADAGAKTAEQAAKQTSLLEKLVEHVTKHASGSGGGGGHGEHSGLMAFAGF